MLGGHELRLSFDDQIPQLLIITYTRRLFGGRQPL